MKLINTDVSPGCQLSPLLAGALALMGETLGNNHISLAGGGVFQNGTFSNAYSWWKKRP